MGSGTWMSKSTDTVDPQRSRSLRNNTLPLFFLRGFNFRIPVLFFSRSLSSLPRLSMSLLLLVSPSLLLRRPRCMYPERISHAHSPLLPLPRARSHSLVANTPSFLPPSSFLRTARRCPMLRSCFLDLRALSPACSRVRLPALELVRQGNREGASLLCQEHRFPSHGTQLLPYIRGVTVLRGQNFQNSQMRVSILPNFATLSSAI